MTSIGLLILLLAAVVSGAIITRDAENKIKSEKPEVNKPDVPLEKNDPKKENGKDGQADVNPTTTDEFLSKSESKLKDVKDGAKNKLKDDVQDLPEKLKPEANKPAGFVHGSFSFKTKDGKTGHIEVHIPIKEGFVFNSASQQDDAEVEDNISKDARKDKREPQLINGLGQNQQAANGGGIDVNHGNIGNGHYFNPTLQINQVKKVSKKASKSTTPTTAAAT